MTASPFDSHMLNRLFPTGETGRLFSDTAELRAMLIVEGALAGVQGAAGIIPETSAAFIRRAALEVQIDPAGLAEETGRNGVCVPALVAAFRKAMEAPEHAQYLHWGATSQDIIDTALTLRLRQVLSHYEQRLRDLLRGLAGLAEAHADTPMAARTYGQAAVPGSFGGQVAQWGAPLLALLEEMQGLRDRVLWVSLSGAAGTGSALGPDPAGLRAALAEALQLRDPGRSWHTDRTPVLALSQWAARLLTALAKIGGDLLLATQSGLSEVRLGGSGASSTMPQKQNPVGPSALVALHVQGNACAAALGQAGAHRQARDGAAWFAEWLLLPQLCLASAAALNIAAPLVADLAPDARAMRAGVTGGQGLLFAEALSFALAARMPRPEAQAEVKALCAGLQPGQSLPEAALARWPDLPPGLFDPAASLGAAPREARGFADAARRAIAAG